MACTLFERKKCSPEEENIWKKFFPQKKCAYCGEKATHLDHLYPLIINKRPTGYLSEPANLVPCCPKCNQPKKNIFWEEYMNKLIDNCKTDKEKKDMQNRMANIASFQKEMPVNRIILDDKIIKKWDTIITNFEKNLKKASNELSDMQKKIYGKQSVIFPLNRIQMSDN